MINSVEQAKAILRASGLQHNIEAAREYGELLIEVVDFLEKHEEK